MLHNLMARHAVALALACTLPASVWALDLPKHSAADSRIRYANYNPADVIQLDAVIGVATHIVLEEGEEYVYHVFGDSEAYAFTHKANHLFFKPVANDANTNLIVVTNRRNYTFRIGYSPDHTARALYKLVLRYPDTEVQRTRKAAEKNAVQAAFQHVGHPTNWRSYTKSGDISLAPVHAWDDGRQTWMQFAHEADIPAVYRVTADEQEVITNYHMADERTMVLHRTASKWHIRLGNQVTAIHNASSGPAPVIKHTGTASPNVRRVVHGSDAQTAPTAAAMRSHHATVHAKARPVAINEKKGLNMSGAGDMALMPAQVWERQEQTWMRFSGPTLPVVYAVNDNGEATAVTSTIKPGNTLVLDGIAQHWLLRQDSSSLTISKSDKP